MARDLSTWLLWVAQRQQGQGNQPQQGPAPLILNPKRRLASWSDAFDIDAVECDAWLLRNGSVGAPAGDLQPVAPLRSMTDRLRKAKQLAESGSKYGLLQAVLLSMDCEPLSAKHWLQQQVALEACSLLLLPECGALQVDLGALRAAYSRLPPAEQQLWCQLQDARIHHARNGSHPCVSMPAMQCCLVLGPLAVQVSVVSPVTNKQRVAVLQHCCNLHGCAVVCHRPCICLGPTAKLLCCAHPQQCAMQCPGGCIRISAVQLQHCHVELCLSSCFRPTTITIHGCQPALHC
jgi:hypothetical protein